jgi:sigma-B regulation protein RsbU (phosphoserine phosphatase)
MNHDTRILVVDDDVVIIKIITNILNKNEFCTDSCNSGEAAINMVKDNVYDLVLLDVQMGTGMDGYQACKAINKLYPDLPIILVTANQDDESVNKGFISGSSDYIKKPVSKLELLARVNKTIDLKRSEKRNLQLISDLSKNLRTAASIQEAMLPKWVYLDKEVMFASHYEPSESVGGDLFDRIKLSEDLYVVYIGDISGHGVQAALLMTAIKSIIKIMVENDRENLDLPWLLTKLNERVSAELFISNNYLTLLIGVIDLTKNEFRFLNAGHPPLIIINTQTRKSVAVESKGSLPLGWMPKLVYSEEETGVITLSEHEIVLLFTDGIYECVNPGNKEFGIEGLIELLEKDIPIESCVSLPYRIKQFLTDHHYCVSSDDYTLFAFQKQKNLHNPEPIPNTTDNHSVHYMITLRAALKEVGKTATQCEKLILNWTDDSVLAAKVELIIDEFLNNIIKYGYTYEEDSAIVVEFIVQDNVLRIKFWDKGIEWEPEEHQYSSEDPYNFERDVYDVSGKGVKIIMSMSDKFHRTRYDQLNETTVEIQI